MIDADLTAFTDEVRRVATVMRLRASPAEITQITQAYFKAFRRRPLPSIIAGADRWIEKGDRFPKPAQWLDCMPRRDTASTSLSPLSRDEADEWLQAERQRYEGRPCGCVVCLAASVQDRPIRFVPDVDDDGLDARGLIGDREVTRGHWAHGDELWRWYVAKAQFWSLFQRAVQARTISAPRRPTFEQRIDTIFKPRTPLVDREPGEEG